MKRVVLFLDGGGVRAAASLGVLERASNAGMDVTQCVGVSAGALFGAVFCLGLSIADVEQAVHVGMERLADLTTIGHRTSALRSALRGLFGDAQLGDCRPGLAVVRAVGRSPLHTTPTLSTTGYVADAVLATMAYPGLVGPICVNGQPSWDGTLTSWTDAADCETDAMGVLVATTRRRVYNVPSSPSDDFLVLTPSVGGIWWNEADRLSEAVAAGRDALNLDACLCHGLVEAHTHPHIRRAHCMANGT